MKVLIIEDEMAAARRLHKLVVELLPAADVVGQADSIEDSLLLLSQHDDKLDLIFMDIHLADGSSFEIFKHIEIKTPIIFTTAYDQYAVQAFKVNAVDYLLKPIKKEELDKAIRKYQQLHKRDAIDYGAIIKALQPEDQVKRFLIRFGQQIRLVSMDEVAYFYTQDKITLLVNKEGKRYPIDYSLEKLEEQIDSRRFFRINRQFIVCINSIEEMYMYSKSRVRITLSPSSDIETIVSTERSPHFKKWLVGE